MAEARGQCDGRAMDGRPRSASVERLSRIRRASVRLSVPRPPSIRHKVEIRLIFGLMTDGRRMRGGQTSSRDGCIRPSVHRVSVALLSRLRRAAGAHPSHIRRLSAAQPPSIRHKAEISVVKTSLHRRCVVAMWSGRCLRRHRSRRIIVACSSRRRRTGVALSSHRRRIVVASSSHRRRAVVTTSSCSRGLSCLLLTNVGSSQNPARAVQKLKARQHVNPEMASSEKEA